MKIFVYGTLLHSESNHHYLKNSIYLGPASIKANLYNIVHYPAIAKGKGITFGEIYEVNEQTLQILDEFEKYYIKDNKNSLYIRKNIEAQTYTNKKINTQAYFYNWEINTHSCHEYDLISHGDYRRFLLEQDKSKHNKGVSHH